MILGIHGVLENIQTLYSNLTKMPVEYANKTDPNLPESVLVFHRLTVLIFVCFKALTRDINLCRQSVTIL